MTRFIMPDTELIKTSNSLLHTETTIEQPQSWEPIRPFRLVKYFSFTGFIVIFVFTLALTIFISYQGRSITLAKSKDYSRLLADNLNHQVFLQFVIPMALQYGRIRLRDPAQYKHLDTVVRNTIHSFDVKRVNIYDLEGTILYSTDEKLVGTKKIESESYNMALAGQASSTLITEPSRSLGFFFKGYTLRTFFPLQG